MAASAEIITKPVASAISLRWIISGRDDVIWFIGSVVSSYALLVLYVSGLVPLVPMVAAWAILIDAQVSRPLIELILYCVGGNDLDVCVDEFGRARPRRYAVPWMRLEELFVHDLF